MKNIDIQEQALYQRSNIESNKQFQRLLEKTQVVTPKNGQIEVIKNRLTHSYEVATSSLMMATHIAKENNINLSDVDFNGALFSVSLLHDIGHCAFGHEGAVYLNNYFSKLGVNDGFSDNNNNLVVIDKNNIVVSDYTIASVIKYPEKLYKFQQKRYIPILEAAIKEDKEHFQKLGIKIENQKMTIACQIMDEADRNSYACSDLSDFLCLGNSIDLVQMHSMAKEKNLSYRYSELNTLSNIIKSGSKGAIKAYFNDLKNRFNCNYKLNEQGIVVIDKNLQDYREFLSKLCFEFFINPFKESEVHQKNLESFKQYVDDVVSGVFSPSDTYSSKIKNAKTEAVKFTYMRDMIAEVSDWYIYNYKNNQ